MNFCLRLLVPMALALSATAASAAVITIINNDPAGQGFNDPTVVAPLPSNPGATLGAQRLYVFQTAANQWATVLNSAVQIDIGATFESLTCDASGAVLGSAGPYTGFRGFTGNPGAPYDQTWFAIAEANALSGSDLDAANPDIVARFNLDIDSGCLGGVSGWWYETDGSIAVPNDRIALMPVVFHEIAHGLGFLTFTNVSTGQFVGTPGKPSIWDHFLMDRNDSPSGTTWVNLTATARKNSAIDDPFLVWSGAEVTDKAAGYMDPAPVLVINSPGAIAGNYDAQPASFGPQVPLSGISGNIVEALDDTGTLTDACEPIVNSGAVAGNIALVDRGTCLFTIKVANAQAAGAIAVLVANNQPTGLAPMGGTDPTITIPSYGLSQATGTSLRANLPANGALGFDFGTLAGMNGGYLRMYAPNPIESGSSVSHFSTAAAPNLLMEPALNQELFNETDLTVPLFHDIFWPINTAAILNKAPTVNAASQFAVVIDTPSPLTELLFSDIDAGTSDITVSFQVTSGTLTVPAAAGVTPAGSGSALASITGARNTLLAYVANGNVQFTTAMGNSSDVPLTITVNDNGNSGTGGAQTAMANATIVVSAPNTNPVANNDSFTVAEGGTATTLSGGAGSVKTNDTDAEDGVPAGIVIQTNAPLHTASFALNSDGTFSYTHDGSETTTDSFTYKVQDADGALSNEATVNITITPVNDPPTIDTTAPTTATEDQPYSYAASASDVDGPGPMVWSKLGGDTCNGTLTGSTYDFTPAGPQPPASCVLSIQVCDSASPTPGCNTETATINITAVNDPPTLDSALGDRNEAEGVTVNFDVSSHFSDPDGDVLSFSITSGTLPDGISFNNGVFSGTLSYVSAGMYTLEVTADDSNGGTVPGTFQWAVTDAPPAPDIFKDGFEAGP